MNVNLLREDFNFLIEHSKECVQLLHNNSCGEIDSHAANIIAEKINAIEKKSLTITVQVFSIEDVKKDIFSYQISRSIVGWSVTKIDGDVSLLIDTHTANELIALMKVE